MSSLGQALLRPSTRLAWYVSCASLALISILGTLVRGHRPAPGPKFNLGMQARMDGDELRVNWDSQGSGAPAAKDGVLRIVDGSRSHEVRLGAEEAARSSLLYRPNSNEVVLRLEIRRFNGEQASESVLILDALRQEATASRIVSLPRSPPASRESPAQQVAAILPPKNSDPEHPRRLFDLSAWSEANRSRVPVSEVSAPLPPPTADVPVAPMHLLSLSGAPPILPPQKFEPTPPQKFEPPKAAPSLAVKPARPRKQVSPQTRAIVSGIIVRPTEVQVEVRIDATGRVTQARALNGAQSGILAALAVAAAKQWEFEPATSGGVNVPSSHSITFQFKPPQ